MRKEGNHPRPGGVHGSALAQLLLSWYSDLKDINGNDLRKNY